MRHKSSTKGMAIEYQEWVAGVERSEPPAFRVQLRLGARDARPQPPNQKPSSHSDRQRG